VRTLPSIRKVSSSLALLALSLFHISLLGVPSPLTITSPKPGNIALTGVPLPIKWSVSSGVPENAWIKLEYSTGGDEWTEITCLPIMSVTGGSEYLWNVPRDLVGKSVTIRGLLLSSCGGGIVTSYGGDEVGPLPVKEGFIVVVTNTTENRENLELMGISVPEEERFNLTFRERWETYVIRKPSASPDGKYVAYIKGTSIYGGKDDEVYIMSLTGSWNVQVTEDYLRQWDPTVAPGGEFVAYVEEDRSGLPHKLILKKVVENGLGFVESQETLIFSLPENSLGSVRDPSFSADGKTLSFSVSMDGESYSIYLVNLEKPGFPVASITENFPDRSFRNPSWSPDSEWLAVSVDVPGPTFPTDNCRIGLLKADGSTLILIESDKAEFNPSWSPDGNYLVYLRKGFSPEISYYYTELWMARVDNALTPAAPQTLTSGQQRGVYTASVQKQKLTNLKNSFFAEGREDASPSWMWCTAPVILDSKLEGKVGRYFSHKLSAIGGVPPYSWSLAPGSTLPDGLRLESRGSIRGTPTTPVVNHEFVVQVTDSNGLTSSKVITIDVLPEESLEITTTDMLFIIGPNATEKTAKIEFEGGVPPYSVEVGWGFTADADKFYYVTHTNPRTSGGFVEIGPRIDFANDPLSVTCTVSITDSLGFRTYRSFSIYNVIIEPISTAWDKGSFYIRADSFPDLAGLSPDYFYATFEAKGKEILLPILEFNAPSPSLGRDYATFKITMPGGWNFPWRPGEWTAMGTLKLHIDIPGAEYTRVSCNMPVHRSWFRFDYGLQMGNPLGKPPVSWDEWCYFFGDEDCCFSSWISDCPDCSIGPWFAPKPINWLVYEIARSSTGNGYCFGMCVTARDLHDGELKLWISGSEDSPRLAPPDDYPFPHEYFDELLWNGRISSRHGFYLEDAIRRNHLWQFSMEALPHILDALIPGLAESISRISGEGVFQMNELLEEIDEFKSGEGDPPIVCIYNGILNGHALLAYDYEYLPDGRIAVKVYDPNKPFHYLNRSDHKSTLYLIPGGGMVDWEYDMSSSPDSSDIWHGVEQWHPFVWSPFAVVPLDDLKGDPDGIDMYDIPEIGLDLLWEIVVGSAHTEQITDPKGRFFYNEKGLRNWDLATTLPFSARIPLLGSSKSAPELYFLATNNTYSWTIVGDSEGSYKLIGQMVKNAVFGFEGVETSPDSRDLIEIDPTQVRVSIRPKTESKGFSLRYIRWDEEGSYVRVVTLRLPNFPRESCLEGIADPEQDFICIRNDGPLSTTYDLLIEFLNPSGLQKFECDGISIGPGETHRIKPDWDKLQSATLEIDVDKDGTPEKSLSLEEKVEGPVADAGPDVFAVAGPDDFAKVTLDGTGSYSPTGRPLTYTWTGGFLEGNGSAHGCSPILTFPVGVWPVELRVSDGERTSFPDIVLVRVVPHATNLTDSDGDGIADMFEEDIFGTDPNSADTDGDGIPDSKDRMPLSPGETTGTPTSKAKRIPILDILEQNLYLAMAVGLIVAILILILLLKSTSRS